MSDFHPFIELHAGAGFSFYVRKSEIREVQKARSFFFWTTEGSDITMNNGDSYYVKESPEHIVAVLLEKKGTP